MGKTFKKNRPVVIWFGVEPRPRLRLALEILALVALEAICAIFPYIAFSDASSAAPAQASDEWFIFALSLVPAVIVNWMLWVDVLKYEFRARER